MHTRTQRPNRDGKRTVFECLLWRYGSAVDWHMGRGSGWSRLGYGISPLGEVTINPTIELPELKQDWGNRLLEGTNRALCTPSPRRKDQWPHKRLTQTCLWVSRSLQGRRGLVVACCGVGGTECSSACMEPFEGGPNYLHYLHHIFGPGWITGREHSSTHQQKIGLTIYWAWVCPSEQDPVSPSFSLSNQKASISLLSFSTRGQKYWKHNHRKLTNLITWTTALSNSMTLRAIPCRTTKQMGHGGEF